MAPHAFYFWIVNQLPAVMSPRKVTVVVSPLLALIKDQMDQLQVVVITQNLPSSQKYPYLVARVFILLLVTRYLILLSKINHPLTSQRRRIPCESLNSKMGEKERKRVLADLSCKVPDTRFMYVTPEQCATPTFQGRNSIDLFIIAGL